MRLKSQLIIGIIGILAVITSACSRDSEPTRTTVGSETSTAPSGREAAERDKALVRFAHSDPSAQAADLYFGDEKIFSGVSYKDVTPYKEISGELRELRLHAAGHAGEPLATNNESFVDGRRYTIVAVRQENGNRSLLTINDDSSAPSAGKAKLRVVNANPGADDVDIYAAGRKDSVFSGVDFNSSTLYKEVDPMTTTLEVRDDTQKATKGRLQNLAMEAGRAYTIIVTPGRARGSLDFIQIEDELLQTAARR